jgi:hypothetical protein
MTERTWEITDIDGTNKRTVTLAEYRAEIDAAKAKAEKIYRDGVSEILKSQPAALS